MRCHVLFISIILIPASLTLDDGTFLLPDNEVLGQQIVGEWALGPSVFDPGTGIGEGEFIAWNNIPTNNDGPLIQDITGFNSNPYLLFDDSTSLPLPVTENKNNIDYLLTSCPPSTLGTRDDNGALCRPRLDIPTLPLWTR